MMSRITIHLKRAGDRLRHTDSGNIIINNNLTTLSSPKTIFFKRERHSTQFDTTFMTEEEGGKEGEGEGHTRLSADRGSQSLPPLPPSSSSNNTNEDDNDNDEVAAERVSTAGSSSNHHHDLIHKPPPLVLARPKFHDIEVV